MFLTEVEELACFLTAAVPHARLYSPWAEALIMAAVADLGVHGEASSRPPRVPASVVEIASYLAYALPDLEDTEPRAAERIRDAVDALLAPTPKRCGVIEGYGI